MDAIQAAILREFTSLYNSKAIHLPDGSFAIEFTYHYLPVGGHWLDLINDLVYMFRGLEDYTARYYPNIADLGAWQ